MRVLSFQYKGKKFPEDNLFEPHISLFPFWSLALFFVLRSLHLRPLLRCPVSRQHLCLSQKAISRYLLLLFNLPIQKLSNKEKKYKTEKYVIFNFPIWAHKHFILFYFVLFRSDLTWTVASWQIQFFIFLNKTKLVSLLKNFIRVHYCCIFMRIIQAMLFIMFLGTFWPFITFHHPVP